MQKVAGNLEDYEEKRKKVSKFNLTSDVFFSKVMEDKEACQEVIQIFTSELLLVKTVKSQYSIRNIENHSVVLDVLAEDQNGCMMNVEIHCQEDEDHVRRGRYYISSIDMSILDKGIPYEAIPDVYMIYITDQDFIGKKRGINVVDRVVRGEEVLLDNGIHEFYVNLKGGSVTPEQRELLDFIKNSKSGHKTKVFPNLARRVTMFKEEREGIEIMCEIMARERAEGKMEGKIEGGLIKIIALVRKKHQKGNTPEQIADALELDAEYVSNIMNMIDELHESDEEIAMKLLGENA